MHSRALWIRFVLVATLMVDVAISWAPSPNKRRIIRKPPNKDFARWLVGGFVATSLVLSPISASHAAAAEIKDDEAVTITLTLPRSVIQTLEAGSTPTISIKIAEDELVKKATASNKPASAETNKPSAAEVPKTSTVDAEKKPPVVVAPPVVKTEAPKPASDGVVVEKKATEAPTVKMEEPKPVNVEKKASDAPPAVVPPPVVKTEAPKPDNVEKKTSDAPPAAVPPPVIKTEAPKPAEAPKVEATAAIAEKKPEAPVAAVEKKPEAPAAEKKPEVPAVEKKPEASVAPVEKKPEPAKVEPPKAEQKSEEVKKPPPPEVAKQEVKKEEAPKPPAATTTPPINKDATPPKPVTSDVAVSKPPVAKPTEKPLLDRPAIQTSVQKKMDGDTGLVLSIGEIAGVSAVGIGLLVAVSSMQSNKKSEKDNRAPDNRSGSFSNRVNGMTPRIDYNGSNVNGSPGYNTKQPQSIEYDPPPQTQQVQKRPARPVKGTRPVRPEMYEDQRRATNNPLTGIRRPSRPQVDRRARRTNDPWAQTRPSRNIRPPGDNYTDNFPDSGYNQKEPPPMFSYPDETGRPMYRSPDQKEPNETPDSSISWRRQNGDQGRLRRSDGSYLDDLSEGGYNSREPW